MRRGQLQVETKRDCRVWIVASKSISGAVTLMSRLVIFFLVAASSAVFHLPRRVYARSTPEAFPDKSSPLEEKTEQVGILIIGAGLSGLSAAQRLAKYGLGEKLLVLEARSDIGGRVRARNLSSKDGKFAATISEGANWVVFNRGVVPKLGSDFGLETAQTDFLDILAVSRRPASVAVGQHQNDETANLSSLTTARAASANHDINLLPKQANTTESYNYRENYSIVYDSRHTKNPAFRQGSETVSTATKDVYMHLSEAAEQEIRDRREDVSLSASARSVGWFDFQGPMSSLKQALTVAFYNFENAIGPRETAFTQASPQGAGRCWFPHGGCQRPMFVPGELPRAIRRKFVSGEEFSSASSVGAGGEGYVGESAWSLASRIRLNERVLSIEVDPAGDDSSWVSALFSSVSGLDFEAKPVVVRVNRTTSFDANGEARSFELLKYRTSRVICTIPLSALQDAVERIFPSNAKLHVDDAGHDILDVSEQRSRPVGAVERSTISEQNSARSTTSKGSPEESEESFLPPLLRTSLPPTQLKALVHSETGILMNIFLVFREQDRWWGDQEFLLHADPRRRYPLWLNLMRDKYADARERVKRKLVAAQQGGLAQQHQRASPTAYASAENMVLAPGLQLLVVSVTDEEAERLEHLTDSQIEQELVDVYARFPSVKDFVRKTKSEVPRPIAIAVPRWRADPLFKGSYSTPLTGISHRDHSEICRTVVSSGPSDSSASESSRDRIWFAGEHCHSTHFATMDGAIFSGNDTATSLFRCLTSIGGNKCPSAVVTGQALWFGLFSLLGVVVVCGIVLGLWYYRRACTRVSCTRRVFRLRCGRRSFWRGRDEERLANAIAKGDVVVEDKKSADDVSESADRVGKISAARAFIKFSRASYYPAMAMRAPALQQFPLLLTLIVAETVCNMLLEHSVTKTRGLYGNQVRQLPCDPASLVIAAAFGGMLLQPILILIIGGFASNRQYFGSVVRVLQCTRHLFRSSSSSSVRSVMSHFLRHHCNRDTVLLCVSIVLQTTLLALAEFLDLAAIGYADVQFVVLFLPLEVAMLCVGLRFVALLDEGALGEQSHEPDHGSSRSEAEGDEVISAALDSREEDPLPQPRSAAGDLEAVELQNLSAEGSRAVGEGFSSPIPESAKRKQNDAPSEEHHEIMEPDEDPSPPLATQLICLSFTALSLLLLMRMLGEVSGETWIDGHGSGDGWRSSGAEGLCAGLLVLLGSTFRVIALCGLWKIANGAPLRRFVSSASSTPLASSASSTGRSDVDSPSGNMGVSLIISFAVFLLHFSRTLFSWLLYLPIASIVLRHDPLEQSPFRGWGHWEKGSSSYRDLDLLIPSIVALKILVETAKTGWAVSAVLGSSWCSSTSDSSSKAEVEEPTIKPSRGRSVEGINGSTNTAPTSSVSRGAAAPRVTRSFSVSVSVNIFLRYKLTVIGSVFVVGFQIFGSPFGIAQSSFEPARGWRRFEAWTLIMMIWLSAACGIMAG